MIQELLNGMLTVLSVKFMTNDIPHAVGLLGSSSKVFYHVTPKENIPQIMKEGLYEPVYMLTSVTRAHEWQEYVEKYEPAVVLMIKLPTEWQVEEDPLHPKGIAVVSEERIPAEYIRLNDAPHATGTLAHDYQRPPTPAQLRYIALLCQQLKIAAPYEEQVKTFGEAGRLIRELEEEKRHRRKSR